MARAEAYLRAKFHLDPSNVWPQYTNVTDGLDRQDRQTDNGRTDKQSPKKQQHRSGQDHKASVIIPYIEGASEVVATLYNRYGVSTAMRPHTTIRNLLLHPKDKVNTEETAECAYRFSCKNCQKVYIGKHDEVLEFA